MDRLIRPSVTFVRRDLRARRGIQSGAASHVLVGPRMIAVVEFLSFNGSGLTQPSRPRHRR
jgi:hypothetical protein